MMGAARPETASAGDLAAQVGERLRGLGLWTFALLFAALFFSPYWLVINLVETLWWTPPGLVSADGVNLGRDFVAFFSTASLTLNGEAASVYDHVATHAAQQQAIGAPVKFFPWFYPPFMQMFLAPLALMPYLVALAVWVLVPLAALLFVTRRYFGHPWASAAMLIFPGTAQSVLAGQNGVLSALIVTAGLLNLERRPVLAGVILGALSYKPHVAATVYAALLFGRYWRVLGTAIAVAASLSLMSLIVLGPEPWLAFLREAEIAKALTEDGSLKWSFMTTAFAAGRLGGLDIGAAYALQAVTSCAALLALFVVWRRDLSLDSRAAVLVTAIPLMTPYAFCYDLPMVGIALLWFAREAWQTGFRRGETIVFAAAWVIAPLGWLFADWSGILVTPAVLAALLGVLLLRILGDAGRIAPAENARVSSP